MLREEAGFAIDSLSYNKMYGIEQLENANLRRITMNAHPWFACRPQFDAIALVASAGGIEVFAQVLSLLPAYFPVPILVLLHRRERRSKYDILVDTLRRRSRLQVVQAEAGQLLQGSTVYVAPPNQHLILIESNRCSLVEPDHVSQLRPSADMLFESLAEYCGSRCIGVVLSGSLNDGSIGAAKLRARGGTLLVQDPRTAFLSSMPQAIISAGCAQFVLTPGQIAHVLTTLAMVPGASYLFCSSTPHRA